MIEPNCTTCRYAQSSQLNDAQGKPIIGKYQFNCVRFPPSAFIIPTSQGTALGSAFPVVTNEQVCSLYDDTDSEPKALDKPRLRLA